MKEWFVYIVQCADGSLYTGITTDIARRLNEHNGQASATDSASRSASITAQRSSQSAPEVNSGKQKKNSANTLCQTYQKQAVEVKAQRSTGKKPKGKGAAYTAARRPVKLFYSESVSSRSEASKREAQIKKLPRAKKLLFATIPDQSGG